VQEQAALETTQPPPPPSLQGVEPVAVLRGWLVLLAIFFGLSSAALLARPDAAAAALRQSVARMAPPPAAESALYAALVRGWRLATGAAEAAPPGEDAVALYLVRSLAATRGALAALAAALSGGARRVRLLGALALVAYSLAMLLLTLGNPLGDDDAPLARQADARRAALHATLIVATSACSAWEVFFVPSTADGK
jgi:hypothetical protein